MRNLARLLLLLAVAAPAAGRQPFFDRLHPSKVFGEERKYRIILPPSYETSGRHYPVIYYFHGHSDRYTVEKYDDGKDTIPKMVRFVEANEAIVVCVDGYVGRDYTGFYGGAPWDVFEPGGDYDFGAYFLELVSHVDSTYRTLTDRRHRATSGLSMGGFMSLYLSARYPQAVGSASSFNPGPEFFAGDKGRRVLWRPKDHVASHTNTMVRLIRASGDYISQYHEETREAYARAGAVDFEFRQDEYHRHWATSIEETFGFHMRAFANPALNNVPTIFHHANPYASFDVWGYHVEARGDEPGFTCLSSVTQGGLRVTTRRWAPDGPPAAARKIEITTPPLYTRGGRYTILDLEIATGRTSRVDTEADSRGSLRFSVDGAGHEIGILGPGTGAQPPVLLPTTAKDVLRLVPDQDVALPIRVYNPRGDAMKDVTVELTSDYPTVQVVAGRKQIASIDSGAVADCRNDFRVRLTSGDGHFAHVRFHVRMTFDGWYTREEDIDALVSPSVLSTPAAVEIVDGRKLSLSVFRQAGNQGGGKAIPREVSEGKGNANGVLEGGEEATFWVKLPQGLDPFDKNNWYRCKVHSDSPWIEEIADIRETKQREWTAAQNRTSLVRLAPNTPKGTRIPLLLDVESWSFHFTPDVRYGAEKLYQAYQLHRHQVFRQEVIVK